MVQFKNFNLITYCWERNGTPFQYSCLKIPWIEEPGRLQSMGVTKSQT